MRDLRELILQKSVEIIAENGVRGLSFREVARRAQVSHQAPYHYFKNDKEILIAIAKEGFSALTQAMQSAAAAHVQNPLKALTAAGLAYVEFAVKNTGHFRVMFQRTLLPIDSNIEDLPEADATHSVLREHAQAMLDAGFAKHLDHAGMTQLCWATVHGIAALQVEGLAGASQGEGAQVAAATQVVENLALLLEK